MNGTLVSDFFSLDVNSIHPCSKLDVVASSMLRPISLKNISIWDFRHRLYFVKSSINKAKDNSKTSLIGETPFWLKATQSNSLMAEINISLALKAWPPFCKIPRVKIKLYKLWIIWVITFFGHNSQFVQNSLMIFNAVLIQNTQFDSKYKPKSKAVEIFWWNFWLHACNQKLLLVTFLWNHT